MSPGRREAALTPEEVAAILAVVEARVAEETGAGEIPSAALDAWAAAGRPTPAPGKHRRRPGDSSA
jgi:hypothetical protein